MVDDQISILSGLISGIDWSTLNVTAIRTASNARIAREILTNESIDILLCDIEMPGENGLSLLRWARNKHMDFVCVFLTSHADFLYAKEALQLGCFDYILQPARYEEIQATIAKAITRVRENNTQKKLEVYGSLMRNQTASLFQNLFLDWSAGKSLSVTSLCAELKRLGIDLQPENECFIIIGHLFHWHTEPWPTQEWSYVLNNILLETYETSQYGILPFSMDYMSYGWFIYTSSPQFPCPEYVLNPLRKVFPVISEHFPCEFAFYATPVIPLKQINDQSTVLLNAKQNNILRESGIFCPAQQPIKCHVVKLPDITQLRRWEKLLSEGRGTAVYTEACGYLTSLADSGNMNRDSLRGFYIQFQQTALNAAWTYGFTSKDILPILDKGLNIQSLEELKTVIQIITNCFVLDTQTAPNERGIVEKIEWYVEDNIDQAIGVSDVAAALYMNPDYLSRLFKTEKGLSLKEYIVQRKMQSAQMLLQTTSLPVSIIASKLGYDNFSHFSQAYRKKMGISPTDERKQAAHSEPESPPHTHS